MIRTKLVWGMCLFFVGRLTAAETLVKDVAEFDAAMKASKPGGTIVLADGEWRDAKLVVRGQGTEESPIVVRAQTPGGVKLVGASSLRIGGTHLHVCDFYWKDCEAASEVIAFRIDSRLPATRCRLLRCAIIGDRPSEPDRKWISLYGHHNVVDQCRFEGKRSGGTLLVVWLSNPETADYHEITRNFFGPRSRLGKNGGEIIRVGDSKTSHLSSCTEVKYNYFYRCDGEAEIISNKSGENFYFANCFVGCAGALTLRHGTSCTLQGNLFFGDGRKGTGGIRIIDADHIVLLNFFHGLEGVDARAAISVMNGIPDSPANGYLQVSRVGIADNTLIGCKENIVLGLRDDDQKNQSLPPVDCYIDGNMVISPGRPVFKVLDPKTQFARSEHNYYQGGELGIEQLGGWERLENPPGMRLDVLEYPLVKRKTIGGKSTATVTTNEYFEPGKSFSMDGYGPPWMPAGEEYIPAVLRASAGAKAK